MIELEYTEKEEYPKDSALKRIYAAQACNYTFYVSWKNAEKTQVEEIKGFSTAKKSDGFKPLSSMEEFLNWWAKKLTKNDLETVYNSFETRKDIFNYFFKENPTIKYVDYEFYVKSQQKKDSKQFKSEAEQEDISSIKEFLKQKNYLYLHFVNRERTLYEVLLLDNPKTRTYNILGQSTDQYLMNFILTSLLATQSPEVQEWFQELLRISFGKFRTKAALMVTIGELLLGMPEYHVDEIANVSNDPETPNYNYLDLETFNVPTIEEIPATSAWDEFTALFQDESQKKLFMAWIWSVFEEKNVGRQWLWIRGPGNDGKSRVIKVITKYLDTVFGPGKMYASADSESHKNTYFYGNIHSKRLIVFGDNKESSLMKNSSYQRITGGDAAPIERKYAQSYPGNVYAKILIASNFYPYIDFWQNSEVTRAIVLSLSETACAHSEKFRRNEDTYESRLYAEFENFLKKCRFKYHECKKKGSNDLIVPASVMNLMKATCTSEESNIIQYFIYSCLDFSPEYRVRQVSLLSKFEMFCGDNISAKQVDVFKKILGSALGKEKGCSLKLLQSQSGITAQYMVGCKLKDFAPSDYNAVLRDEDAKELSEFVDVKEELTKTEILWE